MTLQMKIILINSRSNSVTNKTFQKQKVLLVEPFIISVSAVLGFVFMIATNVQLVE